MRKTIVLLMLGGLFSSAALALDDVITVKLEAQNNSGQTGTATLTPQGNMTRVVIELLNAPTSVAQPAHIHLGTCDKLDKAPKWNLEALKGGRSTTTVPVSLETILKEKTAINIHKSAAEAQVYVSCGNIVGLM
jgi:hypothetical protein